MERRWAGWKMDEVIIKTPSWWKMMGDMELQQALQEEDGKNPLHCQEARTRSPPPSRTSIKSRKEESPPPTIRKMTEGWREEKYEKVVSTISWNMVDLEGW